MSMKGGRPFFDGGHDACLSQATTSIVDASAPGGDDSFRKHQRGSQGSVGNFSQDKLSFTGSDTIDMMGSFIYVKNLNFDSFHYFEALSVICHQVTCPFFHPTHF